MSIRRLWDGDRGGGVCVGGFGAGGWGGEERNDNGRLITMNILNFLIYQAAVFNVYYAFDSRRILLTL